MVDAMSEISQERGCGKATMYVITEKGLEMGPFMYGKNTASRVLCSNTGHIYYSRRKDGLRETTDTRVLEEKRRLRIVDLGNSLLPAEHSVSGSSQFGRLAVRDMENCGLAVGKFRTNRAGRRSGIKVCVNNDENKREKGQVHLGLLKEVLDRNCLTSVEGKISENNDTDDYGNAIEAEENEQPVMRSRQTELKELQLKRRSKDLLEELARWKERCCLAGNHCEVQQQLEMEKRDGKRIFPSGMKTASERNVVLPRLNLSSSLSKRVNDMNITNYSKNEPRNRTTTARREKTSPRITNHVASDSKLVFLNPSSIYSQVKAENTAKLNINECRPTCEWSGKAKIRFPSVIDQRTGVMHSVPGVVTYRPCDYNRWSRRNNIVRRSVVHSRYPLVTYVSIFPSIPEK